MRTARFPFLLFLTLIAFTSLAQNKTQSHDFTKLVNPFVGTIGSGNTFTGPVLPYGMVQLGPHLNYNADQQSGTIYGFSHTHLSGMAGGGNATPGDITFMPVLEDNHLTSKFLHSNETASPGYYKVKLEDSKILVELTATTRVGFHKYTFPESGSGTVVLKLENGSLSVNGDEISGCNNNRVYFVARFSKPLMNFDCTQDGKPVKEINALKGAHLNGYFRFNTKAGEQILLKVGISMVSVEGARNNLETEIQGWDFNRVKEDAQKAWNKELGKIEVEGGTPTEQILFYTSFYHAMIHPNIYMDCDRKFRSTNGKVYTATDFDNYTNFSLWDTFRALHPLYTIINREKTSQFIRTFLERYDHNGRMLIMEFDGVEGSEPPMIAYHSLAVLADAYVKGIRNYDVPKAYEAMKKVTNDSIRPEKDLYLQYGFIPADLKGQSVSRTLECSYDDWCVTRLAQDLNQKDFLYYSQRGNFYKNVFSKEVNFMRGRKSNFEFVSGFDPMETINHYTEANAYQYSTFVPQDVEGLIKLMGGDKVFESWLDSCFSVKTDYSKINLKDVTGLIGQYAHGNEPSHHIAYLYNYVGTPWKTQKMVRQILSTLYFNKPEGIDGNEDCGQMSAWYVMSAMGLYSVTPGMDYYVIGSPLFDKVRINLENGKTFEITAKKNSENNKYIQSATLNGHLYSKTFLKDFEIQNGGKVVFEMGDVPNKSWGTRNEDRPHSPVKIFNYAKSPKVDFSDILFLENRTITLSSTEPGATIFYTLDGSEPTENSTPFKSPIVVTKTSVLKTKSFVKGIAPSYPETVRFRKIDMLEPVDVSDLKPGVNYLYKEGDMMNTGYMKNLPVLESGVLETFNVNSIKDERQFGYNFSGYLEVPETGVYTFALEANDGAVLWINDKLIIDNDCGHRTQKLDTKIGLKKGWHPIKVDYFQQGGAKSLNLSWEGPGVKNQEVPAAVLFH